MKTISPPSDEDRRAEDAFERFGTRKPRCSVPGCPVTDWRQLTGDEPAHLLCYEHLAEKQGRSPVEDHHLIGHHNDERLKMPFLGNLHRVMNDGQRDWPEKTLKNPQGSPALKAAACVRASCDWLVDDRRLPAALGGALPRMVGRCA